MYSDAASIIKDHPVLGAGAGGWNLLYHQYQDFLYWTTEVHNHLLQVGVETGIPGMLIWLSLFAALVYCIYRIRKGDIDDQGKVLVWGVATAVFALGAHGLIDFDLSIPSLQILILRAIRVGVLSLRASHQCSQSTQFKADTICWYCAVCGYRPYLRARFLYLYQVKNKARLWRKGAM